MRFARLVASFVVPALLVSVPASAQQCVSPPAGLVSWWRGEGDAADRQGVNPGSLVNGATFAAGMVGQAFSFDGVNDRVSVPDSPSLNFGASAPMTISLWAYRTGSGSNQTILGKRTGCGSGDYNYQLGWAEQAVYDHGVYFGGNANAKSHLDLPLNSWMHVAATFDGTLFRVYLDGSLAATSDAGTMGDENATALLFGTSSTLCPSFAGRLDEVALFDRALSADEIAAIHDAGSAGMCLCAEPAPGPVSWWRAEDDARDAAGGRHGALEGGAAFAAGKVGQGFALDGVDDRAVMPAFPMGLDWTISGWIRPDSGSDSQHSPFFNRSPGNNGGLALTYFQPAYPGRGRKVNLAIGDGADWQVMIDSADSYQEGQWHHLSATKSGDTYALYVDGTLQGTQTLAGVSGLYRLQPVLLGHWHYGSGQSYTGGAIDEVAVFDRALTAAEVAELAGAQEGGICARTCADVSPGPAAWWSANAGDGSDESGDNHGTLLNGATTAPGRVGSAFSLDGVDDYLLVPDSPVLDFGSGDLSIAFWMNLETVNPQNFLVGHDEGGGTANKWIFMYSGGAFRFHLNGPAIGSQYPVVVPYPVSAGIWYFVTLTRTGTLYTVSVNGSPIDSNTSAIAIPTINAPLTIGQAEGSSYVDGAIDELMILTRALSAAEVAAMHGAGWRGMCGPSCAPPPAGLVSWWRGEDASDANGANDAVLAGDATFAPGRTGYGFAFDGSGDAVQIPGAGGVPVGAAPRTVAAWVRSSGAATQNHQGILAYGDWGSTGGTFFFERRHAEDRLYLTGYDRDLQGIAAVGVDRWRHAVATYDGSRLRFFLDGQPDGETPLALATSSAANLVIGSTPANDGNHGWFKGAIDEPALFDRALSAAEVAALYAARGTGMCAERTDLALTKTRSAASVTVGGSLTYTLTATNAGPAGAARVRVVDALPAEVTFDAATPSQGDCSESAGTVACDLGTLAAGAAATVTIDVTAAGGGLAVANTAVASSLNFDTNRANDTATATIDILDPDGALAPSSHAFGTLQAGGSSDPAAEFTLSSTGTGDLAVTDVGITGADAGQYAVTGGSCGTSFSLPSGDSCTIEVTFSPTSAGPKDFASLEVATDAGTMTADLDGTGRSTLTVTVPRPGSGSVTGTGIGCPGDCTQDYAATDPTVSLTAVPTGGWFFLRWEGDIEADDNPVTVDVPTDTEVWPVFATTHTVQAGTSVQDGVDAAGPGDVIEIEAGLYRENVVIGGARELTLHGAGSPLGNPTAVPPTAAAIDGDTDLDGLPEGPALLLQVGAGEMTRLGVENLVLRRGEGGLVVQTAAGGVAGVRVRRSLLTGNGSGTTGGINVTSAGFTDLRVYDSLIQGNEAWQGAGILAVATGSGEIGLTVGASTISGNAASDAGGGVYLSGEVGATVDSSIVRGNTANGAADDVRTLGAAALAADHTDLGTWTGSVSESDGIDADPVFVNPAKGDYHLHADSPCVDAGEAVAEAGADDIDGDSRPQGVGAFYDMGADERVPATVAKVALLGPKGGEQLLGGETVDITWAAPATAVKFTLSYSKNNGTTWKKIADVGNVRHHPWKLPSVAKNASWRVKVVGKTTSGRTVGSAAGAKFTVGAHRIVLPNGGERIQGGATYPVQWQTAPGKTATSGKLYLSTDGGATWKLQAATYAAGRFDWTVPAVTAPKTKCRVKVDLYNGGTKVGSDTSNANFTLLP